MRATNDEEQVNVQLLIKIANLKSFPSDGTGNHNRNVLTTIEWKASKCSSTAFS